MRNIYNIVGKVDIISDIIKKVSAGQSRRVVADVFPSDKDKQDVNIFIEDDDVDDFIELCEEVGIEPTLV